LSSTLFILPSPFEGRGQVAEAREVIATEMAQNLVGAVIRLRTEGCIERRLDALTDIVDAASRNGQLPPVGERCDVP
jgi:hypothetical protein